MSRIDPAVTGLATALPRLVAEVRRGSAGVHPLVVSGPPSAAVALRRALVRGGDDGLVGAVGLLDLERPEVADGAAIVYVIREAMTAADENALRRADRQDVPLLVLVLTSTPGQGEILPYVRATDVIRAAEVGAAAVDAIARRLAVRAPEQAWALAQALPALRAGVGPALVERSARRSALAAATAAGPALPLLTTAQLRLILRAAAARGVAPEGATAGIGLVAAVGLGLAGRGLARRLRGVVPLPDSFVEAAIAYAGTRVAGAQIAARLPEPPVR